MSDIVEVQPEITGSEAPNQPMADPNNAAVVETTNQSEEAASDRPEWLPEKFESAEDLADAYKELEGKLGQPREENAESTEEEAEETASEGEWQAKIQPFTDEYAEQGELSSKSLGKLSEMGFPKELVENYMAGQEALGRVGTVEEQEIMNSVGGTDSYKDMTEWARDSLSEQELSAYNNTMNTGDSDAVEFAAKGLQARYQAANSTPNLLTGEARGGGKGQGFRSNAELVKAMSDPRYANDPAYQEDVQKRLAVSDILG
tara:strand:+ start:582 stop:1361 length:780 start_codon:yes stop_codon:yes gene_type:complete